MVLCVTGSVATIKAADLVACLTRSGASVRVVATHPALHFLQALPPSSSSPPTRDDGGAPSEAQRHASPSPPTTCAGAPVYTDADEWAAWSGRGDPVLHITLRRWADVLLVAPLSANTLAKLAHGMADNLVTCVCRAWDVAKPQVVAPAMNTAMWQHPHTAKHLAELATLGVVIVPPVSKRLVCGDVGVGAMADVGAIMEVVLSTWRRQQQQPPPGCTTGPGAERARDEAESRAAEAELDTIVQNRHRRHHNG